MRIPTKLTKHMIPRNLLFWVFSIATVMLFRDPLTKLFGMSFKSELYSHIILIPIISAYFICMERKKVFSDVRYSAPFGLSIIVAGIILYFLGIDQGARLNSNDHLALLVFGSVTCWIGGFVLFYGLKASRAAGFPLLFLFFLTPIPSIIVENFILLLQIASTETSSVFFGLTGVPVLREGFVFHLPGLSIEVAKQCSGIRSSLALVITSIIAGQLFLRTGWKKLLLILSIFPITVFKNGLRIMMLTLLGAYVDPRILGSELHKSGGIPFFVVALMMLVPVLWALKRSERKGREKSGEC